jgi:hypothetical protein
MIGYSNKSNKRKGIYNPENYIRQEKFDAATEILLKQKLGINKITYPNIVGNSKDYTSFFVLSAPRGGSTYLSGLLQSHPNIVCYNELFKRDKCHFNYPFFPDENDPEILQIRDHGPAKFLNKFVFRNYLDNFSAVGFKMLYPQFLDSQFADVKKQLLKNKKIKIIHLVRTNYLQRLVSQKTAETSGKWFQLDPVYLETLVKNELVKKEASVELAELKGKPLQFNLDFQETLAFFEQSEKNLADMKYVIHGHPVLEISYESLTAHHSEECNRILDFLNTGKIPLYSRLKKQIDLKMSDIIINFETLKKSFSHTKWSFFFEED